MSSMLGNLETKVVVSGALFPMGTKGYSAYEIAVQQGFKGTVDEWLQTLTGPQGPQGPMGPSNIYVGDEEPTDKNINVWFDTNEEADIPTGGVVQESDPTVPDHVKAITPADINKWNNNSGGSGLTTNERNTLIEIINAIGVFNVTNGQELINNFNNAWGGIITEIPATGITLNKSSLEFTSNVSQTLVAIVTPTDTTDKVTWVSNNNGIATVTNGIVYPISNGSCTITASVGNYSAICDVTVNVENTGGEETTGIKQYGSTLIINSGVAVTQDGSTLSLT